MLSLYRKVVEKLKIKSKKVDFYLKERIVSFLLFLLSIFVHISLFFGLIDWSAAKLKITNKPKQKEKMVWKFSKESTGKDDPNKTITELRQKETEAPNDAKYLAEQNHIAKKQMKIPFKPNLEKKKLMGPTGEGDQATSKLLKKLDQSQMQVNKVEKATKDLKSGKLLVPDSSVAVNKARNPYEKLLAYSSAQEESFAGGYQEYIDEDLPSGDAIDLNTSEYRYIGYFSQIRQGIQLVWTYPREAVAKGMQGQVKLEFNIDKDGKVSKIRVLKSSGYTILDKSVVEAIKLASPFAPLPDGFGKDRINISGTFHYILAGFASN